MKKMISLLLLIMIALSVAACSKDTSNDTEAASTASDETVESDEVWTVGSEKKCGIHHNEYHIIPYDLVLCAGFEDANKWAQECQLASAEAGDECPYIAFNIKAFIDKFGIPREEFAAKADLAHYAVYDCEMLYTETDESIELYFSDRERLMDESIKVQNFAFLEHYFVSNHTNTVMDMIVPDDTGAHGVSPSLPQIVQAVGMKRSELEDVIKQMNEKTEKVCGKLMVYDYDLDLIYNEDGSFKTLPVFEEYTPYETVFKYNSLFCKREY